MLKQTSKRIGPLVVIAFLAVGLAAFQPSPPAAPQPPKAVLYDTVPNPGAKVKDIDDVLKQLDKSQQELEKSFKDFKVPPIPPVPPVPPIEPEKLKAEVEKAMKSIDVEKMNAEVEKAMKEVDMAKIKAEAEAAVAKVDWQKMQKEMEKVQAEMPKIQAQLENLKPQIEKSMQEAKESMQKAKQELQAYKTLIEQLDKDGLIDKKGTYTIEHKDGSLIINGKTQSPDTYNKYRSLLPQQKNFTIKKDASGFNIQNDKDE